MVLPVIVLPQQFLTCIAKDVFFPFQLAKPNCWWRAPPHENIATAAAASAGAASGVLRKIIITCPTCIPLAQPPLLLDCLYVPQSSPFNFGETGEKYSWELYGIICISSIEQTPHPFCSFLGIFLEIL